MDNIFFPVVLVIVASLFQGTFGLGMKYVKPLAWEAWWLIYSLVAMVAVPLLWALVVVPDLSGAIFSTPSDVLFRAALFGFLWGVGGILFGLSVESVGMSITYGIVMGLAASIGSLVPLAQLDNAASNPALPYVLAGRRRYAMRSCDRSLGGRSTRPATIERERKQRRIPKGPRDRRG